MLGKEQFLHKAGALLDKTESCSRGSLSLSERTEVVSVVYPVLAGLLLLSVCQVGGRRKTKRRRREAKRGKTSIRLQACEECVHSPGAAGHPAEAAAQRCAAGGGVRLQV